MGRERKLECRRTHLGEQLVHLTTRAVLVLACLVVMLVAEEVVSQERVGKEGLQDRVQVACLSEVQQTPAA